MFSFSTIANLRNRLRPTILAMSVLTAIPLAACSVDNSTGPKVTVADVAGTRPMKTANNKAVPTSFVDGSGKQLTIQSGSLTIAANGTYALAYVGHLGSLEFDLTDEGVVSINGNSLTFTPEDGDPSYTGVRDGATIVAGFKIAGVKFDLGFHQ